MKYKNKIKQYTFYVKKNIVKNSNYLFLMTVREV